MNIVNYISNKITFFNRIKKIYKVLSLIDVVENNGNILISIPNDIAIQTEGNMLIYSKNGVLVTKHKRTHINPEISITITDDLDSTVDKAYQKKILLTKMKIFERALKLNRVKI